MGLETIIKFCCRIVDVPCLQGSRYAVRKGEDEVTKEDPTDNPSQARQAPAGSEALYISLVNRYDRRGDKVDIHEIVDMAY